MNESTGKSQDELIKELENLIKQLQDENRIITVDSGERMNYEPDQVEFPE